ncbi:diguanylate cyclase [Chitinimonas lacunae]|uniref:diguanylate cyclase n=1 Tax=Chitinimonas lacunae TaxID=1963018 RepID=A0ABV8ML54_9NEIS
MESVEAALQAIDEEWAAQFTAPEAARLAAEAACRSGDPAGEPFARLLRLMIRLRQDGDAEAAAELAWLRRHIPPLGSPAASLRLAVLEVMAEPDRAGRQVRLDELAESLRRHGGWVGPLDRALAANLLGVWRTHHGDDLSGLRYLYRALEEAREAAVPQMAVMVHGNLGGLQRERGNLLEAKQLLEEGLTLALESATPAVAATLAALLGGVCIDLGQFDEGCKHFLPHLWDAEGGAAHLHGLPLGALLCALAGRKAEARVYLDQALAALPEGRDRLSHLARLHAAWAEALLMREDDPAAALAAVERALALLGRRPDGNVTLHLLPLAAELHAAAGRHREAYELAARHIRLARERTEAARWTAQLTLSVRLELEQLSHRTKLARLDEPADSARLDGLHAELREREQEIAALRRQLAEQAIRDPLTGLFNHRYLEESLTQALRRAERGGEPLGVVMLDLDHFQEINDRLGHSAGDRLLVELAQLLARSLRGSDVAARCGGGVFCLMLPNTPASAVAAKVERLRRSFTALAISTEFGMQRGFDFSAGVVAYPEAACSPALLLGMAERALFQAKQLGRGRVVWREGEIDEALGEKFL